MSLEMIANPEFEIRAKEAKETLCDCLKILDRCGVTHQYDGRDDDIKWIKQGKPLPRLLRMELLTAAQDELCTVRRQLTLWRIIWAAFVHRDERAILKQYRRMAERERFHDGARVAELLVAVRKSLNEKEECVRAEGGSSQGQSAATRDGQSAAEQDQDRDYRKVSYYSRKVMNVYDRVMNRYNLARAEWITAAITGDKDTIKAALKPENKSKPAKNKAQPSKGTQPRPHAQRTRWVPWQHSTPSWQAAYNTACLYAALASKFGEKEMAQQVVTSLTRAVNDPQCEMGQPTDWIGKDPDFNSVRQSLSFTTFFQDQSERDHQRVNPVPAHH